MRKKVLVVEDDTQLLELLRLSLKAAGFSVATATDGIEALRKARSVSPDLVLLDLVLPELDGFAVCETLRKDPLLARVPIVVVTGLSSELSRLAGIEAGATEFVSKPISPSELVSKMKHLLQHPPAPRSPGKSAARSALLRFPACVE